MVFPSSHEKLIMALPIPITGKTLSSGSGFLGEGSVSAPIDVAQSMTAMHELVYHLFW